MGGISWVDWIIWVIYFTLIFLVLLIYRNGKTESYYKYFLPAFVLKVVGGLMFTTIYVYYYQFGDTFLYHRGATVLADTLINDPGSYFRLLLSENANLPLDLQDFSQSISYSRGAEEWFMVKVLSPIVLVAFNSYLVTTLFMSTIAFWGGWKLFQVLRHFVPKKSFFAFGATFLLPSVIFWGSGIMKDTFTLAGLNLIIYYLFYSIYQWRWKLSRILLIFLLAFFVFKLKGYIIIAFIPGLLFGINVVAKNRIQELVLRRVLSLFFLGITGTILLVGPTFLANASAKYNLASVEGRVKGFHTWHTDVGGSTYNLGEVDYSPLGVVKKIPQALNVTFFRPYLWEASSPVVLVAAIESFLLFGLFLYLLIKLKYRIFNLIFAQPMLLTFFFYCLIAGFIVGFTSYNFGALGRYKIPVASLFVFLLLYLYYKVKSYPSIAAK
jgi:hypothetical protein